MKLFAYLFSIFFLAVSIIAFVFESRGVSLEETGTLAIIVWCISLVFNAAAKSIDK
jgi:hypothetical protein